MMLHSLASNLRKQNWSVVVVELIVVIAGLLLAFQVDRWWEERGDRIRERAYIDRLIHEVKEDIELIEYAVQLAELRRDLGGLLLEVAEDPGVAEQKPGMFLAAIAQAAFTFTPNLISHTFEDLRSTGSMGLIRNPRIKSALFAYYGFHEAQRQFIQLNLMIEFRYFELSANVLSAKQYRWVQDNWFVVDSNDLDQVRQSQPDLEAIPATLARFVDNRALLDWLPRTRGIQVEQKLMHGIRLSRAQELLDELTSYAAELDGK